MGRAARWSEKSGSVFCSTASQHGGQETTITSFHTTLLHQGMIIVGLPYTFKELATMREITGGTPYGASCVTGSGAECADAERSRVGDVPLSGRARDPHIEATCSRNECQVNR